MKSEVATERPILFSAPMVRAILEGRKTQTRRLVKPQPDFLIGDFIGRYTPNDQKEGRLGVAISCPYGKPGDRLWVRETFMRQLHPSECGLTREMIPKTWDSACAAAGTLHYRADPNAEWIADGRPWTPSIHMPRSASRITLEVTGVRVERLQDISDTDAMAEGIDGELCRQSIGMSPLKQGYLPVCAFAYLWDQINGTGSWDANPWAWVVEFKPVEVVNG